MISIECAIGVMSVNITLSRHVQVLKPWRGVEEVHRDHRDLIPCKVKIDEVVVRETADGQHRDYIMRQYPE